MIDFIIFSDWLPTDEKVEQYKIKATTKIPAVVYF